MANKAQSNTTTPEAVEWLNDATAITVNVVPEAPEAFHGVDLSLLAGRTVVDGENVKRPAWRIKAIMGDAEFTAPNAAKAVNAAIQAKFGGTKYHDVKAALADFKLPDLPEAETAPKEQTDWTKFDNAETLTFERDAASEAASVFFKGESDMRKGLKSLGLHIANVSASLENNKAFTAWRDSGTADLQKALANKNSKSELVFVGKLPDAWFDRQPETSNSAKAYQRNFNIDKNDIAEDAAADAWGKKKTAPKAAAAQKALLDVLGEFAALETSKGVLSASFLEAINKASESGSILFLADTEDGLTPSKDDAGQYIAPSQFGTGNRPHELVAAFCKAMAAQAPEAKAEAEARSEESQAAQAVRPRVFAEYGVTEAAMHLARILQAHENWSDVLDNLIGMAERAETETWEQVMADAKAGIDAEKAEAEKAEAETSGDDDA